MTKNKRLDSHTKIQVLKRHLQKKEPVSTLCQEHGFTPGALYQWQDTLFARGHVVFEGKAGRPANQNAKDKKIEELEKKLSAKHQVISELMEELLLEKKLNGVI